MKPENRLSEFRDRSSGPVDGRFSSPQIGEIKLVDPSLQFGLRTFQPVVCPEPSVRAKVAQHGLAQVEIAVVKIGHNIRGIFGKMPDYAVRPEPEIASAGKHGADTSQVYIVGGKFFNAYTIVFDNTREIIWK